MDKLKRAGMDGLRKITQDHRYFGLDRQILKDETLKEITKLMSHLGTCSRAKVGCLIVRDGRIIMTGYNGSPPGEPHCIDVGCQMVDGHCVRTTHAEANAIAFAAKEGISTRGAIIMVYGWVTGGDLGICHACEKLAKAAGILKIEVIPYESSPRK
jgi:dCMP deaminase